MTDADRDRLESRATALTEQADGWERLPVVIGDATDKESLRDETDSPLSGGVLTPASAIGTPLAERLRAVGFTASVDESTSGRA